MGRPLAARTAAQARLKGSRIGKSARTRLMKLARRQTPMQRQEEARASEMRSRRSIAATVLTGAAALTATGAISPMREPCPAGAELDRHRAAQAQGAGQCRRLPHAHLRPGALSRCRPIRGRRPTQCHAWRSIGCCRSGSGRRRVVIVQPRNYAHRQPRDALRDRAARPERARRRGRAPDDHGCRAEGASTTAASAASASASAIRPRGR